jgi:CheY-like chemotaxis protein
MCKVYASLLIGVYYRGLSIYPPLLRYTIFNLNKFTVVLLYLWINYVAIIKVSSLTYHCHNRIKECCMDTTTASETATSRKKKKILVVDDEPDITSLFRKALEREGFSVDAYNDPANSLKNFKPHFYDLIIIDIVMPKMDGFKLYSQLRKMDPSIKILFLTASEKHLPALSKEGRRKDQLLTKPISIHDLLKEVNLRLSVE